MPKQGKIIAWNEEKGFGFISPQSGEKSIFFHISALHHRNWRPKINQPVTYANASDKFGRPCAGRVRLVRNRQTQERVHLREFISVLAAVLFLILVSLTVLASQLPNLFLAAYIVLNLVAFMIYAVDKSAAEKGTWRTRESTLHMLSLAGGWPGALIAQTKLRHKSQKKSFRTSFWITVALNAVVTILLLN